MDEDNERDIDEERQKENEREFGENEEDEDNDDDRGQESKDEGEEEPEQGNSKKRKKTSSFEGPSDAFGGEADVGVGCADRQKKGIRKTNLHLRSKKRKTCEKEPSDEDGEWLPQGEKEKRNRKGSSAHDNNSYNNNNNGTNNNHNKSKLRKREAESVIREEDEEEEEEEEVQGYASTGERGGGNIYSTTQRRFKTERITKRLLPPYLAKTTTTRHTREHTLLLSPHPQHLLTLQGQQPLPQLQLQQQQQQSQQTPSLCVGYSTYPLCCDATPSSYYDLTVPNPEHCLNTNNFCTSCHLNDFNSNTSVSNLTSSNNDNNDTILTTTPTPTPASAFGAAMLSSSSAASSDGIHFSTSSCSSTINEFYQSPCGTTMTGGESEPDLTAQMAGVFGGVQQQPDRAIDVFRNVYRGYYQSLFAGILQQKTEEGVRRVIEEFWVHLAQSPSFQTLRQIQEVRNFIIAYDKAALNELGDTMTSNPSFVGQFMGTFELCEYVKNVACYLPVWLNTSSAVALPRDLLMEAMKTRHDFAQVR